MHISFSSLPCLYLLSRWSRLLLGREFIFKDTHVLRVWDYLFCSCAVEEAAAKNEQDSSLTISHDCADDTNRGKNCDSFIGDRKISTRNGPRYCPILVTLREFMLAMLIHVSTV